MVLAAEEMELDDIFGEVIEEVKQDELPDEVAEENEWEHVLCYRSRSSYERSRTTTVTSGTVGSTIEYKLFRIFDIIPGCHHSKDFHNEFEVKQEDTLIKKEGSEYMLVHNDVVKYTLIDYNDDDKGSFMSQKFYCCGLNLHNVQEPALWTLGKMLFWLQEHEGYVFSIDTKPDSAHDFEKFMSNLFVSLSKKTISRYDELFRKKTDREFRYCCYDEMLMIKILNVKVQQAYRHLFCSDCLEEYVITKDFKNIPGCQFMSMSIDVVRRLASKDEMEPIIPIEINAISKDELISGKRIIRSDIFATATRLIMFLELEHDYTPPTKYMKSSVQRPYITYLCIDLANKEQLNEALEYLIGEKNKGPYIIISQEAYGR